MPPLASSSKYEPVETQPENEPIIAEPIDNAVQVVHDVELGTGDAPLRPERQVISVPVGEWRDGFCDCCTHGCCHGHCVTATFCPLRKFCAHVRWLNEAAPSKKGSEHLCRPFSPTSRCSRRGPSDYPTEFDVGRTRSVHPGTADSGPLCPQVGVSNALDDCPASDSCASCAPDRNGRTCAHYANQ
jgi:hypothetical protein